VPTQPFDQFLEGVRAHEPAAIETFRRFTGRLLVLSANHLDPRLRRKLDPEDVLQSVLRSFFAREASGQLVVRDWGDLWGVLTVMTLRKCRRQAQRYKTGRRDLQREIERQRSSLESSRQGPASWEALSRDPSPSESAMLAEAAQQFMNDLSDRERDVLTLMLAGATVEEIGERLGRTERTVRRQLVRIKERLLKMKEQ
jgi:RNA polymerase sigma factor (sigma-70 family)